MNTFASSALFTIALTSAIYSADIYNQYPVPSAPPANYYEYSYVKNQHSLKDIPDTGVIELEDGSRWQVDPFDISIMGPNWYLHDPISISPNTGSGGGYYLTNTRNRSYVRAMLKEGPYINGPCTYTISGIDHTKGIVFVNRDNGYYKERLSFTLDKSYKDKFARWKPNQAVIFGDNTTWDWFWRGYDLIIINVATLNHAAATKTTN